MFEVSPRDTMKFGALNFLMLVSVMTLFVLVVKQSLR